MDSAHESAATGPASPGPVATWQPAKETDMPTRPSNIDADKLYGLLEIAKQKMQRADDAVDRAMAKGKRKRARKLERRAYKRFEKVYDIKEAISAVRGCKCLEDASGRVAFMIEQAEAGIDACCLIEPIRNLVNASAT
jgi:hypothetical protein